MKVTCTARIVIVSIVLFASFMAGCGKAKNEGAKVGGVTKQSDRKQMKNDAEAKGAEGQEIDWCKEHGMPESICVQCNVELAADYKKKGDWCREHKVPASQCFVCDPGLKEKVAAEYRTKYGEEPPPTDDDEKAKRDGPK